MNYQKTKSEFGQKLIDLRRVARVVAGGRRFNFRATLVIGNGEGKVGVGTAKGRDTTLAIEKAFRQAKKNLIQISITKDYSISHEVSAKFGSALIILKPAKTGRGIVAGGSARTVFNLAGIKNISAKIISRSKNKINNAKATIEALKKLKTKN